MNDMDRKVLLAVYIVALKDLARANEAHQAARSAEDCDAQFETLERKHAAFMHVWAIEGMLKTEHDTKGE